MLSDSDSETEDFYQLTINEHYAKAFEYKKEREELEKLKQKYGSDFEEDDDVEGEDEEDSESDEDEDSDGEELSPAVDAAILRTLARIRRKDADIYDSSKNVFQQEREKLTSKDLKRSKKNKAESKPVTLRQVVLDSQLRSDSRSPSPESQTFVDEQKVLRSETIAAFHEGVKDGDEEEEIDFLVPREKTKDELEREEEEYREFLEREVGKDDLQDLVTIEGDADGLLKDESEDTTIKKKKRKKKGEAESPGKSKEEKDQEFLMNYILNRGWIDREARRIPTYGEITSSRKKTKKGKEKAKEDPKPASEAGEDNSVDEDGLNDDSDENTDAESNLSSEAFDDIVDRFESSYNFRFEEPDAATIKSYPRVLPSTVRREDSTRKEARVRKKQRREEELKERREEVRRLKALKMKELRHKLDRIGKEGGKKLDDDPALKELDLEGDWDPTKHDQQMVALYGGDGDDEDFDEDNGEKPVWDDDIDIGDIGPDENEEPKESKKKKKKKKRKKGGDDEETGVDIDAMDADVAPPGEAEEEWDGTEEMRKRKLDEYMDEIHDLDFNDMVAGMPTRFKYVTVQPQNHALSAVEILMASDKELNEYMSVKKYAPYRTAPERKWDSKRTEKLKEFKAKITERMGDSAGEWHGTSERKTKRKGKKERMKQKAQTLTTAEPESEDVEQEQPPKKSKKRKMEEAEESGPLESAENGTTKKRKRRHKKK